jgi:hypothetical protein
VNENYNNQNEDNINKNEHNSTGNNGVLESLKNSCKYRGCLFPGGINILTLKINLTLKVAKQMITASIMKSLGRERERIGAKC